VWLLAKGENVKAEKAMCWLRGWTEPKTVELEFIDLVHYNKITESQDRNVHGVQTNGPKSLYEQLAELKDPSVYKPLKLMMIYFFVSYLVSLFPVRPYITYMLADVNLSQHQNVFMVRQ
jgi:SP family facilitated glucose transporter-like MFS transporter 8